MSDWDQTRSDYKWLKELISDGTCLNARAAAVHAIGVIRQEYEDFKREAGNDMRAADAELRGLRAELAAEKERAEHWKTSWHAADKTVRTRNKEIAELEDAAAIRATNIAIAYADRRVEEAVGEAKALVLANARLREIEQKYVDMLVDVVPKRVALVEEIIDIVKSVEPSSWVPTSTEFVNTHVTYQHALGDVVKAIRSRALSPAREGGSDA